MQKAPIDTENFFCTRLTSNRQNKTLIQGFSSERNSNLAYYLKKKAWFEDSKNYRAYYLVREKDKIVLYYSLQCGLLFTCHKKLLNGIIHKEGKGKLEYFIDDDKINVTKVIPAMELAHFCVNDSYRKKKATWSLKNGLDEYSVGAYVFYAYITPQILSLASTIGVQYVYLFCADDGSTNLAQYYSEVLHFDKMDDMACVRPEYDMDLNCMTIKISELERYRNRFVDMGNLPAILQHIHSNGTLSTEQAKMEYGIKDPQFLFKRILDCNLAALDIATPTDKPLQLKQI